MAFNVDWDRFAPQRAIVGGLMMALASQILMWTLGQIAGVSGIFRNAIRGTLGWQTSFVAGLLLAGTWTSLSTHALEQRTMEVYYGRAPTPSTIVPTKLLVISSSLVMGYGATLANGCTSGHGVCGIGRASPRSVVAVLLFMVAGVFGSTAVRGVRNYLDNPTEGGGFLHAIASVLYEHAGEDATWTLQSDAQQRATFTFGWAIQLGIFVLYWVVLNAYLQWHLKSLYDIPVLAKIRDMIFGKSRVRRESVAMLMSNGLALVEKKKNNETVDADHEDHVADIGEDSEDDETKRSPSPTPSPTPEIDAIIRRKKTAVAPAVSKEPPISSSPTTHNLRPRSPAEVATLLNQHLISAATGFLFGYGLAFSGMGDPERVQSFLDPLGMGNGKWDITLIFVMLSAVTSNLVVFKYLHSSGLDVQILHGPHGHPVPFAQAIKYGPVDANMQIDKNLVWGSLLFGVAWGALGVCPGPGLVSFSTTSYPTSLAVPFIGVGALARQWIATSF